MQSLTAKQLEVLEALSSGQSVAAAAAAFGIHRTTIHTWSRTNPEFHNTLEACKQARADAIRDRMNRLVDPSFGFLERIVLDESVSPSLRVRTTMSILKFMATYQQSPAPKTAASAELLHEAFSEGYQAGLAAAAAPAGEQTPIHHNSSLFNTKTENPSPTANQTPRNALCPCGSKLKFKRCCGKNAPPVLSRAAAPQFEEARS
jgi:hypothetical protein